MKLQEILNRIDENQIKISAFGKFDDAILKKINYKFRLDWNYYSNKMEGGTLTRDETRSVMVGNITVGGKPIKDVMEMKGHDTIVLDILKIGRGELKISEKRIKDIHKAIMHEETLEKTALIGEWKKTPNEIINYESEKISFSIPADVPELMHQLVDKTNSTLEQFSKKGKNAIHPLLIASNFHLDFVTIHPFYDGNGRTTRMLTNLILITCGLPPIIIKESDKKVYYQYLADIQAYGGDRELFHSFLANKLLESQQLVLDALEGKDIEERDDLDKKLTLFDKELEIIDEDDVLKWHLDFDVVNKMYTTWIKNLLSKMIPIAQKFNKYYTLPNHNIRFSMLERSVSFTEESPEYILEKIDNLFLERPNKSNFDTETAECNIRFFYGPFKKGGINSFGCNYSIRIKFEFIKYIYTQDKFAEIGESVNSHRSERLLSNPLNENEISFLSKEMGEALLKHMEFNVKKTQTKE